MKKTLNLGVEEVNYGGYPCRFVQFVFLNIEPASWYVKVAMTRLCEVLTNQGMEPDIQPGEVNCHDAGYRLRSRRLARRN